MMLPTDYADLAVILLGLGLLLLGWGTSRRQDKLEDRVKRIEQMLAVDDVEGH
jgi:hypothetical protein